MWPNSPPTFLHAMQQHNPRACLFHRAVLPATLSLAAQTRVVESLSAIPREAWNACFPGELEDYDYLLALEESRIAGFAWRYVTIEEHGLIIAAMPAFLTDYALDTTLDDGALRRFIRRIRQKFPRFLVMKLACLGSPQTESGRAGFHPSITADRKPELLAQLIAGFEHHATLLGHHLLGAKDIPDTDHALWMRAAPSYSALAGMATAELTIDFASIDAYLNRLSKATRKDMRRKTKPDSDLRIEQRTDITDQLAAIEALYLATKARSEFQFEELNAAYFGGVMARMKGRAHCTLYYRGDTLLAVNLMLANAQVLLDKFFCMDAEAGREHNLYFRSWFYNVHYCLEHQIPCYRIGQAGYDTKQRLKSHLNANWMLFKHANPVLNRVLKCIAPLLAMGD